MIYRYIEFEMMDSMIIAQSQYNLQQMYTLSIHLVQERINAVLIIAKGSQAQTITYNHIQSQTHTHTQTGTNTHTITHTQIFTINEARLIPFTS